jgi:hypothetical protein
MSWLDSNGDTLRKMGNMGFSHLAVGTGPVQNGQGIPVLLAVYKPSTGEVNTIQYPFGQFGSKNYTGNDEVRVYFSSQKEFDDYAGSMKIKMCSPTRLPGYK